MTAHGIQTGLLAMAILALVAFPTGCKKDAPAPAPPAATKAEAPAPAPAAAVDDKGSDKAGDKANAQPPETAAADPSAAPTPAPKPDGAPAANPPSDAKRESMGKAYIEAYCAQRAGETERLLDIYTKYGFKEPKEWTSAWTEAAKDSAWVAKITQDAIRKCP